MSSQFAPEELKPSLLAAADEAENIFASKKPLHEVMEDEVRLLKDLTNKWVRDGLVG